LRNESRAALSVCSERGRPIDRPKENPATVRCSGVLAGSNAKCEQCNHTHSGNQHCECYRIVIQPMQPLLHDKPPCLSEKAAETTSPAAVGSAVKESVQGKPHHWAKVVAGFPAPVLLGSEISFGAAGATLAGGDEFRGTVSVRSHCGPNSDTGLCEVKARGEYRVSLPTPVTQPRLAHDWRGFFVKCAFAPAASFLRMPSWPPHASQRSRVWACDPRDVRMLVSTSTVARPARRLP
jgi:hypothetical protein